MMKLLLVDDNERMRNVLRTLFSPIFDEVVECSDGTEAIVEFESLQPDWTIMDIKMKEMDGITATKKIREQYPEAKIIITSQYNDETIVETSIESGAIEFVNKDDLERIEEIIKSI